ncbi:MAG: aldo/keto reductase [Pseudomonadota bacterium]
MSMNVPAKKLNCGFEIPTLGMGTWLMGGGVERDVQHDDSRSIAAIQQAVRCGITHIDTSEMYANGHAEKIVGAAIKNLDRSKLFLSSKVWMTQLKYQDVIASAQSSLERLGIDHLDLYLVHAPNSGIPIKGTMEALDALVGANLVKHIGVCNFNLERLQEAQQHTRNKIVVNQLHYNLMYREPEAKGLLEYCQRNDVMFVAWRPLELGLLFSVCHEILESLCEKYGKTPAQVMINWLISQNNVVTISKMSQLEHVRENMGALGWQMESADIEYLRRAFPSQKMVSNVRPLI